MSCARKRFGLTSMQEKASPTPMPVLRTKPSIRSGEDWRFQPRPILAQVTVSMCIYRWTKQWTWTRGKFWLQNSNSFVIRNVWRLTSIELVMRRQYFVLPAPGTESTAEPR